jgi:hypothetical protein
VLVIAYNLCQNALLIPSVQTIEIDEMIGPLKATIDFKVKGNAVKQEVEKNQELVRSALRAVAALSKLADMGMYSILLDQCSDVKIFMHSLQRRHLDSFNLKTRSRMDSMLKNTRTYGTTMRTRNIAVISWIYLKTHPFSFNFQNINLWIFEMFHQFHFCLPSTQTCDCLGVTKLCNLQLGNVL